MSLEELMSVRIDSVYGGSPRAHRCRRADDAFLAAASVEQMQQEHDCQPAKDNADCGARLPSGAVVWAAMRRRAVK